MDRKRISALTEQLNTLSKENQQVEYWLARELQHCLGYRTWENFEAVILRAMVSAETAGAAVEDHFREVTKWIMIGKGGQRPVPDYMLTRYACYLIAQNGDPRKEEIAFAQSYFAVSARTLEVVEERIAYMEGWRHVTDCGPLRNGFPRTSMSGMWTRRALAASAPREIRPFSEGGRPSR